MIVVHVCRRPLSESTVASNTLQHGCGALNIDATRIGTSDNLNGGAYSAGASKRHDGAENWRYKRGEEGGLAGVAFQQPTGRWPANLVLEHLPECRHVGTQEAINRFKDGMKPFGNGAGHDYEGQTQPPTVVDAWECVPECPVTDLDEQSGSGLRSGGRVLSTMPSTAASGSVYGQYGRVTGAEPYQDAGGASRYFKQVGSTK